MELKLCHLNLSLNGACINHLFLSMKYVTYCKMSIKCLMSLILYELENYCTITAKHPFLSSCVTKPAKVSTSSENFYNISQ